MDGHGKADEMTEGPGRNRTDRSQTERILQWDRLLSDAAAAGRSFAEIMETGRAFLPYPYAFLDTGMDYIYATRDFRRIDITGPDVPETDSSSSDRAAFSMQELLLDKRFHEAAKETSLFYYYLDEMERSLLCCNLFLSGKYYARMLLDLKNGQKKALPEEEALFLFFCRRIENLLSAHGLLQKQPSDIIHSYLLAVASGQEVPESLFQKAAEYAGFRETDTFCVIDISFFSEEGWNTQYEIMLPFISHTLEAKWEYSCVVPLKNDLIWLVDLNRSEANIKSRSFYQELAFFLREYICTAGISSRFTGFENVFYAIKQAAAALEIGKKIQPSFWYYLFDDYRLHYMLQKAGEEIPVRYLKPSPLLTLEEYDREKNAELCRTLRTYLRNSRNDSRTAEQLHIHRTTLYRRLERIHRLTGLRLDHPDTVLELLMIWAMAGYEQT